QFRGEADQLPGAVEVAVGRRRRQRDGQEQDNTEYGGLHEISLLFGVLLLRARGRKVLTTAGPRRFPGVTSGSPRSDNNLSVPTECELGSRATNFGSRTTDWGRARRVSGPRPAARRAARRHNTATSTSPRRAAGSGTILQQTNPLGVGTQRRRSL